MSTGDNTAAKLKLGTRGSELALYQANLVKDLLQKVGASSVEIVTIKTRGDREMSLPFAQMAGQGFFTKEIERALVDGTIDLAVHSHKDLETTLPPGLQITAVPVRDDRREILIIRPEAIDRSLKLGLSESAIVGTSSVRRIAQLIFCRPDLQVKSLRGNVPTRVKKLRAGEYDAIVIAAAGVRRLGLALDGLETIELDDHVFIPPPAQGALAIQTRADDKTVKAVVQKIDDTDLRTIVEMEREVLRRMGGGCQLPLGVIGDQLNGSFRLSAFLGRYHNDVWESPRRITVLAKTPGETINATVGCLKISDVRAPSPGLRGKRIVITRSRSQSADFCREIETAGADVLAYPTLKVVEAGDPARNRETVARLDRYDWVLFSSVNGVEVFFRLLQAADSKLNTSKRIGAIGRGTKVVLEEKAGRPVDFVPTVSTGKGFAVEFGRSYGGRKLRVLIPGAAERQGSLEANLQEQGFEVEPMVVYNTVCPEPGEMPGWNGQAEAVVFTSPKAARFFRELAEIPGAAKIISIGPSTSEYLANEGVLPVYEAFEHDMNGILEVLNVLYR